jgi:hypothetical protein
MDIYRLETLYGHMTVTQGFVVGDQAEACGRFHELVLFPDLSDNLFFRSGKLLREGLEQCLRRLMVRCRFLGGEQFPAFWLPIGPIHHIHVNVKFPGLPG